MSVDEYFASRRVVEKAQLVEDRALASTRAPHDGDEFAVVRRKVDTLQDLRDDVAVLERPREIFCLDHRSISTENRVERILPDYHPRRDVAGDERGNDEEPDAEEGLVERRDKNAVAKGKIYRVRRERGDEKTVHEKEADGRTEEGVKYRLEYVRHLDGVAADADALQDADVLATRERVDEDDDEYGDGRDNEPDGGERVAEHVEGRDDILEEFRLGVLVGLDLGVPVHAATLQRVAHCHGIAPRLQLYGYFAHVAVGAAYDAPELRVEHEGAQRYLVHLAFDDAFDRDFARYIAHFETYLRADADIVERRECGCLNGHVLLEEVMAEHYLVVITLFEERAFNDIFGYAGHCIFLLRVDARNLARRGIRLVGILARLVVGLQGPALPVARRDGLYFRHAFDECDDIGTVLDVGFVGEGRDDDIARVFRADLVDGTLDEPHKNAGNNDEVEEGQYHHEDDEAGRPQRGAPYLTDCKVETYLDVEGREHVTSRRARRRRRRRAPRVSRYCPSSTLRPARLLDRLSRRRVLPARTFCRPARSRCPVGRSRHL